MVKTDDNTEVDSGGHFCRCKERRHLERLEQRILDLECLIGKGEEEIECPCDEQMVDGKGKKPAGHDEGEAGSVDDDASSDREFLLGATSAAEQDEEGMVGQEETDAEIQEALEKAAREEEAKQEAVRVLQQVQFLLESCSVNEIIEKIEKVADLEEMTEKLRLLINEVAENAIFGEKEMKQLELHTEDIVDKKLQEVSKQVDGMRKTQDALQYLEDLLESKANCSDVANFVTVDMFDAACDDLTKGIDDYCEAINQQEVEWQKSFVDVKTTLDQKLDRCEMKALKDFLHKKLTCIVTRLKALEKVQEDIQCAATRPKIIRDLRCIICDATVVMSSEVEAPTCIKPSATPRKFMKIENEPQCLSPKMIIEESKMKCKEMPDSIEIGSIDIVGSDTMKRMSLSGIRHQLTHICKRYCGGAHTVTTPQDRILRVGNFYSDFKLDSEQRSTEYKKFSRKLSNIST